MKTVMFPGQGSQVVGMGKELFDQFPDMTKAADEMLGYSIRELCVDDTGQRLHKTQYTQPALYVVNALSYQKILHDTSLLPDYFIGHSLGEYNALQAAGAFSFLDGLRLVIKRGDLMSKAPKGAMAAILKVDERTVRRILDGGALSGIDVANFNSPQQTVISGLEKDIRLAETHFTDVGMFIPLNTSGAFHSRYLEESRKTFQRFLTQFEFQNLNVPVISNVHAKPYTRYDIPTLLADQITHSVRWCDSIVYLLQLGDMKFEELGVGNVLQNLVLNIRTQVDIKPSKNTEKPKQEMAHLHDDVMASNANDTDKPADPAYEVDLWNKTFPIGTDVSVRGYEQTEKTRSKAILLFGHKPVLYIKGYKGYFELADVKPVRGQTARYEPITD